MPDYKLGKGDQLHLGRDTQGVPRGILKVLKINKNTVELTVEVPEFIHVERLPKAVSADDSKAFG